MKSLISKINNISIGLAILLSAIIISLTMIICAGGMRNQNAPYKNQPMVNTPPRNIQPPVTQQKPAPAPQTAPAPVQK